MSAPSRPPRPPESAVVDRALACRCVLWAVDEARAADSPLRLEELDVRRCPVGPLLAIDCPEWTGAPCRMWTARGDEPPVVIGRDEAAAMRASLAAEGTLSARYRRRLRPLTTELRGEAS